MPSPWRYALLVPFPESIPVRYTEEEAGYLTVRPLVQQTFRIRELADMVLRVTGKDAARVRQIFHGGTVVYNGFRYWWTGFDAADVELAELLATFPSDDPSRPFRVEECSAVLIEYGGGAARGQLEITRAQFNEKPLWQRRSLWDVLAPPPAGTLDYAGYSHARGGDIFRRAIKPGESQALLAEAAQVAPRALRARFARLPAPSHVVYICPRK